MSLLRLLVLLLAVLALARPLAAQPAASMKNGAAPAQQPAASMKSDAAVAQPTVLDDKAAIDAGRQWLELIDAGKAGEAWDVTAAPLKASVTRAEWVTGMAELRKPFGKLVSRTSSRFARTHAIPNAPDGDYAIVEYQSVYALRKSTVEQLTWVLEADGNFRIAGYFIR
jgi:hypothetical protein